MIYLLKNKKTNPLRIKILLAVSLFCFLFLLSFFFGSGLRSAFVTLSVPVWFLREKTTNTFSFIDQFFSLRKTLISENESLKKELENLTLKEADCTLALSESVGIKNQTGISSGLRIPAVILSSPPFSPYDTLVLGAGSDDGVFLGQNVFASEKTIIGKIVAISPKNSTARLFSAGDQKLQVFVERTGASFEISGRGGANFIAEIPKDVDLVWGDTFTLPTLSAGMAILGSVYFVDESSQGSFKKVYARMPGNIFQNKIVFIEK